tara:strand:+ start:151 stop:387 length:237 start_codon:yes stop_codon:yes gene_type:complete
MSIETLIEELTAEQIVALAKAISDKGNVRRIDTSRKEARLARNNLYFSSCPKPHQVDSFDTYIEHSDSIREQVSSGVE